MKENELLPVLAGSSIVVPAPAVEPRGKKLAEETRRYAFSERTKDQYQSLWKQFVIWWGVYAPGRDPRSVTTQELTWYLAERKEDGRAYATLLADFNAIDFAVRRVGRKSLRSDIDVAEYLSGCRKQNKPKPDQKKAILPDMLNAMVDTLDDSPISLRNRALLLVGWCSGQRREELVRMTLENLFADREMAAPGYKIEIPYSKTDQEGEGRDTMIHRASDNKPCYCPCAALEAWLHVCRPPTPETPIFRGFNHGKPTDWSLTGNDVARIIKARCKALGEDPSLYGGHSLRRGLVTYMFSIGKTWQEVARYTGHTSEAMTLHYKEKKDKRKPFPGIR